MTEPQENYDAETGLLSAEGLVQAIEAELARSARHELPLSLIYVEVTGLPEQNGEGAGVRLVAATVAEALLGAVRAEDRVARVRDLRFAVLAPEAGEAAPLAQRLAAHATKHLRTLPAGGGDLAVAVASVDCEYDEMARDELLAEAERRLAAAILEAEGISFPPKQHSPAFGDHFHQAG